MPLVSPVMVASVADAEVRVQLDHELELVFLCRCWYRSIPYRAGGASQDKTTELLRGVAATPVGDWASPVVAEARAAVLHPAELPAWSSMS